jgi:hypothetical protein
MSAAKRQHAGAAVGGLFDRPSATGGLAGRAPTPPGQPLTTPSDGQRRRSPRAPRGRQAEPRVRLGVELTETEVAFVRALGRPARTGGPRSLGAKFVATGILAAAVELLGDVDVDMAGVNAGDLSEITARARAALLRAGTPERIPRDKP